MTTDKEIAEALGCYDQDGDLCPEDATQDRLIPAVQKLLTQAYQAGIDEAVEILESKKQIVSQHFLDKGDEEMVIRAILNHRLDDTIKALQDKK